MSKRSKRKHRQQTSRPNAQDSEQAATSIDHSQGAKRQAMWMAAAVLVVAAVVYAVTGGFRSKEEKTTGAAADPGMPDQTATALTLLSTNVTATSGGRDSGPRIVFAEAEHDFGQMKGGEIVKHTFVFTNVGDSVLEVTGVHASCGCTTMNDWSRRVEPGQTGSIPVQFNSGSFSGQVAKTVSVTCNDTNQPTVTLFIKANIWRPIDVAPQYAMFNLNAATPAETRTVRIVNNEETPLALSAPESSNPAFAVELSTNQPGKEFQLLVKTVPPLAVGMAQGQITLKTSSTNMPVINVTAMANVQTAAPVTPSESSGPAGAGAPAVNPAPTQ